MHSINELYQERMNKLLNKINNSSMKEELAIREFGNNIYKNLVDKIMLITDKPVWEDFNFKTGKIFGILRTILQNPIHKDELLKVTGLNQAILDVYYNVCGNLPYLDNKNIINEGRPMNVEATKEFIPIVAAMLNISVTDDDLNDITQERWDKLYNNALQRAKDTQEFNKLNKEPQSYDE